MRDLRGRVSGLCQPTYVLDVPGGFGKIPAGPEWISDEGGEGYRLTDPQGRVHPWQEAAGGPGPEARPAPGGRPEGAVPAGQTPEGGKERRGGPAPGGPGERAPGSDPEQGGEAR